MPPLPTGLSGSTEPRRRLTGQSAETSTGDKDPPQAVPERHGPVHPEPSSLPQPSCCNQEERRTGSCSHTTQGTSGLLRIWLQVQSHGRLVSWAPALHCAYAHSSSQQARCTDFTCSSNSSTQPGRPSKAQLRR